jgi:hypothetical protein
MLRVNRNGHLGMSRRHRVYVGDRCGDADVPGTTGHL